MDDNGFEITEDEEFSGFEVNAFSHTSGLTQDDFLKLIGGSLRDSFEMQLKQQGLGEGKTQQQPKRKAEGEPEQDIAYMTHLQLQQQPVPNTPTATTPTPTSSGFFPFAMNGTSVNSLKEETPTTPASMLSPMSSPFPTNSTPQFTPQQPPQVKGQPQVPTRPSQQLLNDIHKLFVEQKQKVEKNYIGQKQLMASPKQDAFNALLTDHRQVKEAIESELKLLQQLFEQVVLEPQELQKYFTLKYDLEIQHKQVDILLGELQNLVQPNSNPNLATLVITKQPFPLVISKAKQLSEDQFQVQLITASNVSIQSVSQVKAAMLTDAAYPKGNNQKMLEADSQSLDNSRTAKFPLKFLSGTKKAPAQVRFGMQIQISGQTSPVTIESNSSAPLVVITNECQWEGSAGTLLKREAYAHGQLEIPWPKFANALQHHFIRATRQDLGRPKRILSAYDMQYIHQKFFQGKQMLGHNDFDTFWDWFGKSMQKLRYQRHICAMWLNGLIYGFMGRDDVNASLRGQEPGTFIIRFSESHYGQFAIAYTGTEKGSLKHYLVQPTDTSAKKTLPDFLQECPQFMTLLVLTYDDAGRASFVRTPKEVALEPFVGKKQQSSNDSGYDPL